MYLTVKTGGLIPAGGAPFTQDVEIGSVAPPGKESGMIPTSPPASIQKAEGNYRH